jgi:hypothetical protein
VARESPHTLKMSYLILCCPRSPDGHKESSEQHSLCPPNHLASVISTVPPVSPNFRPHPIFRKKNIMSHQRSTPRPPAKPGSSSPSSLALHGMEQYGGPSRPLPRRNIITEHVLPPMPSNYIPEASWLTNLSSSSYHAGQSQQHVSPVRPTERRLPPLPSPPPPPPPPFLFPDGAPRLHPVLPELLPESPSRPAPREGGESPINASSLPARAQMRKAKQRVPTLLTVQPFVPVEHEIQPPLVPARDGALVRSLQFSGSLRTIAVEEEYGYGITSQLHGHHDITPTREHLRHRDTDGMSGSDMARPSNASSLSDENAQPLELINEMLRVATLRDSIDTEQDPPPGEITASSSHYSDYSEGIELDDFNDNNHYKKAAGQLLTAQRLYDEHDARQPPAEIDHRELANDDSEARDIWFVPQPLLSNHRPSSVASRLRGVPQGRPQRVSMRHVASKRASVVMRGSGGRHHVAAPSKNGRRLRISPPIFQDSLLVTPMRTAQDAGPGTFTPQEYPTSPSPPPQEPVRFVTNLEHSGPKSADHVLGRKTRMSSSSGAWLLSRTFSGFHLPMSRFSNRTSAGTTTSLLRGISKKQSPKIDEAVESRADKTRLMLAKTTVDVAKKGVRDALQRLSEAKSRRKREKRGKEIKEAIRYIAVVDPAKAKYDVIPPGGWI